MRWWLVFLLLFSNLAVAETTELAQPLGANCRYPDEAIKVRAQGISGLYFRVGANGKVTDVSVGEPSGDDRLDAAAVQCITGRQVSDERRWKRAVLAGRLEIYWINPSDGSGEVAGFVQDHWRGEPHRCDIDYPANEAEAGADGTTKVTFVIKTDGTVRNVAVSQSSGNKHLDKAAIACVSNWRYFPAIVGTSNVEVPWHATINWAIEKSFFERLFGK